MWKQGDPSGNPAAASGTRASLSAHARESSTEPHSPCWITTATVHTHSHTFTSTDFQNVHTPLKPLYQAGNNNLNKKILCLKRALREHWKLWYTRTLLQWFCQDGMCVKTYVHLSTKVPLIDTRGCLGVGGLIHQSCSVSTVLGKHVVSLGNNWPVCQFYGDPVKGEEITHMLRITNFIHLGPVMYFIMRRAYFWSGTEKTSWKSACPLSRRVGESWWSSWKVSWDC